MHKELIHSRKEQFQAVGSQSNCRQNKACTKIEGRYLSAAFVVLVMSCGLSTSNEALASNVASKNAKAQTPVSKKKFVSGVLYDLPFQMAEAFVSPRKLSIYTAMTIGKSGMRRVKVDYHQGIDLTFPQNEKLTDQTFSFKSYEKTMLVDGEVQAPPALMLNVIEDRYPEEVQPTDSYTVAVKFYKPVNGMLPGFIDLVIYGTRKTHLNGYFYAKMLP